MLINTIKPMDVVSLKLISGEEIVGGFLEKTETYYKIRKPLALVVTQQGPSLAPFFMTGDITNGCIEIEFSSSSIIAMIKPHKQFSDVYTQATSGIQTPANSPQLKL